MRWGRLALLCARFPAHCYVCLTLRYWYCTTLGISTSIKKRPSRAAALLRRLFINRKETDMDYLMKIVMGGWIPQGKRSQTMAAAVAIGTIITSFVQWGSGDMSGMDLVHLMQDKWQVLVAAYMAFFVAEKIDAKK